jgi:hypothetical protein
MPNTPRMGWPFPERDLDPWYNALQSFANQQDASAYAHREDRNIIVMEGDTFTFASGTGLLTWSDDIEIFSPIVGFLLSIPAGSLTLSEGGVAYVSITRSPTANAEVAIVTDIRIPSTDSALLIAVRRNDTVYFRNGVTMVDGDSKKVFESGSGGGAGSLAATLAVGNITGSNDIEVAAGQGILFNEGAAISTGADQGAIYVKSDNKLYYRAESDGSETDLTAGGGGLSTTLGLGNTSGANDIEMDANQGIIFNEGTAVSTGADQGALYVKADNNLYYRAESDGSETQLNVGGGDLAATLVLGNTTGGNDLVMSSGDIITAPVDLPVTITGGAGGAGNDGGNVDLTAGDGGAGGGGGGSVNLTGGVGDDEDGGSIIATGGEGGNGFVGGVVNLIGGAGNITNGDGGTVLLRGGAGGGTDGAGGTATVQGGAGGTTAGSGGGVSILGGDALSTATGGSITITSGDAPSDSGSVFVSTPGTAGATGQINLTTGDTTGAFGFAGQIALNAGNASGASGVAGIIIGNAGDYTGASGNGGDVDWNAGNAGTGGGNAGTFTARGGVGNGAGGTGGACIVIAGTGGATDGTGGNAVVEGGTGGATNGAGGNVRLIGGAGTGSGADGEVQSETRHRIEVDLVFDEVAEPSTAAGEGVVFASDGSGSLDNNGLYYRRESDGTSIRLDVVEPYEVMVAPKDEVDGVTGEIAVGQFAFNTSEYTNYTTFKFRAILSVSDTARTGEVYLYNLTDSEEVTSSRQSVTGGGSTSPAKVEATLTAGSAAGNLQDTEKIYEVRITNDGTLSTEYTFLGSAHMRLEE